jgi:lipopolysaccharide/colanic/teichoic acid biosynthesis glycosyltransferase
MKHSHRATDITKRFVDIAVSGVLLVLLSPLLVLLAVLVRVKLGSPVLFSQPRAGLHGRIFTMKKFRSMLDAPAEATLEERVASDGERLTLFGQRLRSTSLDELPSLWNVLVGDMGLVGPRPLLPEYLDRYNETQARRHEVRPGVTGWAQVNGRNATTWEERFDMDVYYVDHRSLGFDARILWLTVATVLKREGVSAADGQAMPPFDPRRDTADRS